MDFFFMKYCSFYY